MTLLKDGQDDQELSHVMKTSSNKKTKLAQVTTSDLLELSNQADIALRTAKAIEGKVKKHLTTVKVGTAVIRTTDPEKWEQYARENKKEVKICK